jgi:hypothetical protein
MAIPNIFNKSLQGQTGTSFGESPTSSIPSILGGAQIVRFLFDAEGGFQTPPGFKTGSQGALTLAEIVAKSTQFKGRFIDDIFVLLFTRPSELQSRVNIETVALAASALRGNRPDNLTAYLPNFYAFVFRINPTVHRRQQTRDRQTVLTKGGYLTHYWSSGMRQMTFQGSSGALVPPERQQDQAQFNIRQTDAYANFLQLKRFYEDANQDVALFFLGRFLQGALADFNFTEDADNPYQIKYEFKFDAYPEQPEIA